MRSFIALEFEDELKENLVNIQNKIKENSLKGTWTHEDNFHLTLKFLGEIDENSTIDIDKVLEKTCKNHSPINLTFSDLGYFKGERDLRVLWLGTKGDLDKVNALYEEIENEMYYLGFQKENRAFKPHITLGRRVVLNKDFSKIKDIISEDLNYDFTLKKITLMKSEEIMKKRVYTPIKTYNLKKIDHR
ncbi:RNA 2',3'-cyclic phosphodiesterase [Sporanaerobacter acetigenes]|uniref:RNA 2',3'-cyclic phosphodiesterase n=1 Tax=Sporanaerobacter acetigenes DSM 13106 TaxID=1123281 RepID=A0A1M5YII3_9FIRM|nr:RNA 2',3'-cyclic phosphodiesterase [Sporanaerobacter acetigenes]SHI11847.1 2'-5' RNA ligase [Sporanaerobacter acetigenes DSM 13106]